MRFFSILFCFLFTLSAVNQAKADATSGIDIDKILISKAQHKLSLIRNGKPFKTYTISLGKSPIGNKQYEGDNRTPEGVYWIDWRKTSDNYQLSMHISYPNSRDAMSARKKGLSPGGMIMIHGTPIDPKYPEWLFNTLDWTNGCIAMKNRDMREVWSYVKDGTLVDIRP